MNKLLKNKNTICLIGFVLFIIGAIFINTILESNCEKSGGVYVRGFRESFCIRGVNNDK